MARGAVGGDGGQRDDQVAELEVVLEPAAGADAQEPLDAEQDELLHDDRRGRTAHAGRLHRDRLALVLARIPQQSALGVLLHGIVEVRLRDVLRAQRVAGQQAGLCVVAFLRSDVNRHGGSLLRRFPAVLIEPTVEQVLAYCAEDPIERVFLEDVARRGLARFRAVEDDGSLAALCYFGANIVPSGIGCDAFADEAAARGTRMIIGNERAVTDLWSAAQSAMPEPREDRPGQPVYVLDSGPGPVKTGLREATLDDVDLLLPACAATHHEELGIDPLQRDAAGFRRRTISQIEEGRSWLWAEDGTILFKAEASAWTPQAVQLQQVWVDPEVRRQGHGKLGLTDLCRLLLERPRPSPSSSGRRTSRRSVSTRRSACGASVPTGAFFSDLVTQCY